MNRGFSLVELLVAMVISIFLLEGLVSFYIANKRTSWSGEALSRTTEVGQVVFELMARDIRQAGGNPCGMPLVANLLCNIERNRDKRRCRNREIPEEYLKQSWAMDWNRGPVEGFDDRQPAPQVDFGTGQNERVEGTDAIVVRYGRGLDDAVVVRHNPQAATFQLRIGRRSIEDGDIVMVCDDESAAIFQVTRITYQNGNRANLVHEAGKGNSLNCFKELGYPANCDEQRGTPKDFTGGFLADMVSAFWYVGCNGRVPCDTPEGRSLYRLALEGDPDGLQTMEIAEGVWDLQIQYRLRDGTGWLDACDIDWSKLPNVRAVRLMVTLRREVPGGQILEKRIVHAVNLRNMESVE